MQTMHLTLPVGPYGWDNNPLGETEFRGRIDALRAVMETRGWSGLVVFGDIPESGLLTYVSNFAPRLSAAFALIPLTGEPAILTLDGGRMVDAGKETTWIKDVSPAADLAGQFQEWLDGLGAGTRVGLAGFGMLPAALFDKIFALAGIASGEDATADLAGLARSKSPAELAIIRVNCGLLQGAAAAAAEAFEDGASAAAAVMAGESAARLAGAQDVRSLYSVDGGASFKPYQGLDAARGDPSIVYLALRARGYWVDGFITLGNGDAAHQAAADALQTALANLGAGKSVAALRAAASQASRHPLLAGSLGGGIGVSAEEAPRLDDDGQVFQAGDVVSIKISHGDTATGYGWASSLVSIGDGETSVLWTSG
jgi:Xaa-Pro aminopeptidase